MKAWVGRGGGGLLKRIEFWERVGEISERVSVVSR